MKKFFVMQGMLNYIGRLCNKPEWFSEEYVCNVLERMDKTDPDKRSPDQWDKRFRQIVPVLHRYDSALAYLQQYGYLCQQYFSLVQNPQNNPELQRIFCRVRFLPLSKEQAVKYPNLLCSYLERWDFCPQVLQEIFGDAKYASIRRVYGFMQGR